MPWRPGRHNAELSLESPYEDVPAHLRQPLLDWTEHALWNDSTLLGKLGIHMRMGLPSLADISGRSEAVEVVMGLCESDSDFQLEVINYALSELSLQSPAWKKHRAALQNALRTANSAYQVRGDQIALEMRVAPGVQETVQEAVASATGSAGAHLTEAWNQTYALSPDAVKAYSESIKAVEAAMAPVVSPRNLKATLGTMIGDVRTNSGQYRFVIQDGNNSNGVEAVLAMMTLLWEGQTSRHGGVNPTRPETKTEAQAALHLAATLVEWASSGSFARK